MARQTTPRGVAVLTGAGGMMGSAIARELSGRYHLVLNDRRDCLEPLLASLQGSGEAAAGGEAEAGGEVVPVVADVSRPEGAVRAVETALERWGRIDALVNIAGGLNPSL